MSDKDYFGRVYLFKYSSTLELLALLDRCISTCL